MTNFSFKKVIKLLICFALIGNVSCFAREYYFGSFNMRMGLAADYKSGNGWNNRVDSICNFILFNSFDILGAQEVNRNQLKNIASRVGDVYSHFGVGRQDGVKKGEFCPIFYKKSVFKLLASDTFWLSETPDKVSKGWDANSERICTWGCFEEIKTKNIIYFFNLHADTSANKAREGSCNLLLKTLEKKCKSNSNIVVTGDFNFSQYSDAYKFLSDSRWIKDSYASAKYLWAPQGTINYFKPNSLYNQRIDYIWVSKFANVSRFGVLNNFYFTQDNKPILKPEEVVVPNNNKEADSAVMKSLSDHLPIGSWVSFE